MIQRTLTLMLVLLFAAAAGVQAQLHHFTLATTAGDTNIPPQNAGVSFFIEIIARDSAGGIDTAFTGTVGVSSGGTLIVGGGTTASFVKGVLASQEIRFGNTGTFTLTATQTGNTITGTSRSITVNPGAPARLAFVQQPSTVRSGLLMSPAVTVQVEDSLGNAVAAAGDSVHLSLAGGSGTLTGVTLRLTSAGGLATFDSLRFDLAGTKTLGASVTGLAPAVSIAFQVIPGTVTQMAFTQQPTTTAAGAFITPAVVVQVQDAAGNSVDSSGIGITIQAVKASDTLFGVNSKLTNASGQAIFDSIRLKTTGSKSLVAKHSLLPDVTSSTFMIVPGTPARLMLLQEPGNGIAGSILTPAPSVQLTDAFGNPNTTAGISLTVNLKGTGILSGTTTVPTVTGGSATFSGLRISQAGTDSLTVTGTGLDSVTTAPFLMSFLTITATAGPNGSITPSGIGNFTDSATQRYTFTPSPGYHVDSVLVDGFPKDSLSGYTFAFITTQHTIRVVFALNQYTITASAGPNGTISPPGVTTVNFGGSQAYTITPNTGYHIDSLLIDGVSVAPAATDTFQNVQASHTIRAVFAINQYTITATAGTNGSISPAGAVTVNYGAGQIFTFTPVTGYHVDSIIVDGVNRAAAPADTFVNVTANHTIRVTFAINQYVIVSTTGPNGTIAPLGTVNANYGDTRTFTIIPNTGYHVDSLIADGVLQTPAGSYTFPSVAANHTIRVTFAPNSLTIVVTPIPDTLTIYVDNVPYKGRQSFTWTAATQHTLTTDSIQSGPALTRYRFGTWSDTTAMTHTVAPLVNTTYTASFRTQFYLAMTANPGGTVSPASGYQDSGVVIQITAIPDSLYHWTAWSGTFLPLINPASITISGPTSELASFSRNPVTITVQTAPDGLGFYYQGSYYTTKQTRTEIPTTSVTLLAPSPQGLSPTAQYVWKSWSDGGAASHTITVPDANTTYTATFGKQFLLSVTGNTGGTVSPSTSFRDTAEVDTIRAIPNTGYHFVRWTGTGTGSYSGTAPAAPVSMNGPVTDSATFAIDTVLITASAGTHGQISPSGSVKVTWGSSQTFSLLPDTGYHVDSVFIDGVMLTYNTGGSYTFSNVTTPRSIRVTFRANNFTITATAGSNGSISPSGGIGFSTGDTQRFTFTPNAGYHVDSVIVDGVKVDSLAGYTFANIAANHTIRVTFIAGTWNVTVRTLPDSLQFTADGTTYRSPHVFNWVAASGHTLGIPDTQATAAGVRYLWKNWSDAGTKSHTFIPYGDSVVTASFRPQYFLTMQSDTAGSVTPASSWQDSGAVVQISALPKQGYRFTAWTGTGVVSPSDTSNPANITMTGPLSETAGFGHYAASVTIRTTPAGRTIVVDAVSYTSPRTFSWTTGSAHTISAADTQAGVTGTRYIWKNWSDAGARSHTVVPLGDSSITAQFTTQYFLTTLANPGGQVTPASGWLDTGTVVTITALPNAGYHWVAWSGVPQLYTNPSTLAMTGPISETASFALNPVQVTVQTVPNGRSFRLDGGLWTIRQTRTLNPGEVHSLDANTPQPLSAGVQYAWYSWSDGGSAVHGITVPDTDITYTAYYRKQFLLTVAARTGGTVSPASTFLDTASVDTIRAIPSTGYHFMSWIGSGPGSYTGTGNPAAVTLNGPVNDTAVFAIDTLVVTASAGPHGAISPSGAVKVTYGSNQVFAILPDSGYHADSVIIDGTNLGYNPGSTVTLYSITTPRSIRVTFKANNFTITATSGPNGTIVPSGVLGFSTGDTETFAVQPNNGYLVDSIIVDGVWVDSLSTYTFYNILANHTIRATFRPGALDVTLRTQPDGLQFSADGIVYTSPHTFRWVTATSHTIAAVDTQVVPAGTRHLWVAWSGGGAKSHIVTPVSDTTFTASFRIQYYLTTLVDSNGTVTPASSWHDSGAVVQVTAIPSGGYQFAAWTGAGVGSYTGTQNPVSVTMLGPVSEKAGFGRFLAHVTIRTSPDSLMMTIDGTDMQSPASFNWVTGSAHSIATVDSQSGHTGTRFNWNHWSDGGALAHSVTVSRDTTITARFLTQHYLTMNTNAGGSVTPVSGWQDSGAVVTITAIPQTRYIFSAWAGIGTGSTSSNVSPTTITMNGPITETANFTRKPVQIVVQTDPPGRYFLLDGQTFNTPQTRTVNPGDQHALNVPDPQDIGGGSQYTWVSWSDSGARFHTIAVDSSMTFTADFKLQYALNVAAMPPTAGSTTPSGKNFADSGSTVILRAIPNQGFAFTGWTGDVPGQQNPIQVRMNGPRSDTANFVRGIQVTFATVPAGRKITADDSVFSTPATLWWVPGSLHRITVPDPQPIGTGLQYVWSGWSDSGAVLHTVAPTRDTVFVAGFRQQVYMTMNSGNGGTVIPPGGWFFVNDTISIKAIPDSGYAFVEWTGTGGGSYSGTLDSVNIHILNPITETASFGRILPPPGLSGLPDGSTGSPTAPMLTWNPYTGATSYTVQVSTDSTFHNSTRVLLDSTLGGGTTEIRLSGLANLTTYYWRVRVKVVSDVSPYTTPWKFTTMTALITVSTPPVGWATRYMYTVRWTTQDLSGPVTIRLSTNGGSSYFPIVVNTPNTGSWVVPIPDGPSYISNFCKVRVESALNGAIGGETGNFSIVTGQLPPTVLVSVSVPFPANPTTSTSYRLFSLPGIIDTVQFSDFLKGTSGIDWRSFTDNGASSSWLEEESGISHLTTGLGYWLLRKGNLSLPSSSIILPLLDTLGATYGAPLHDGWNIVGNPFDKNISWQAVQDVNNLPPNVQAFGYDGSFSPSGSLERGKAYYFLNEFNLPALKLPYPFGTGSAGYSAVRSADWQLQLTYETDLNRDPANYIGIAALKDGSRTVRNVHKPPFFLDQGFLSFPRPDLDAKYPRFSTDYRPVLGSGQVWEFEIVNPRKTAGTLQVGDITAVPDGLSAVLIGEYNTVPVDLRKQQTVRIDPVSRVMHYRLIIGDAQFVKQTVAGLQPSDYSLEQNFPNPFNSSTAISVRIPRETTMKLDVYSILGEHVRTLADGRFQQGVHTFLWDGRDSHGLTTATGVYFYRVSDGSGFMQSKKMIFAK